MTGFVPWSDLFAPILALAGVVIGAIIPPLVSNFTERQKFQRNKLWEKRSEVYGSILHDFSSSVRIGRIAIEYYDEDPERADQDERAQELVSKFWSSYGDANLSMSRNFLFISDGFLKRVEEVQNQIDAMFDEVPPDRLRIAVHAVASAVDDLSRIAKADLKK